MEKKARIVMIVIIIIIIIIIINAPSGIRKTSKQTKKTL